MNKFALLCVHNSDSLKNDDYALYCMNKMQQYCNRNDIDAHIYYNTFKDQRYDISNNEIWKYAWSRYYSYELFQKYDYQKILWLDSDILITKNLQNIMLLDDSDRLLITQDISQFIVKHRNCIGDNPFYSRVFKDVYNRKDLTGKMYIPSFSCIPKRYKQFMNIQIIHKMYATIPNLKDYKHFMDITQVTYNIMNKDIEIQELQPLMYCLPYMMYIADENCNINPIYQDQKWLLQSKCIHFGGIGHNHGGLEYRNKVFFELIQKYGDRIL